jgi:hypothetical protein
VRKGLLLSLASLAVCGLSPAFSQTTSAPAPAAPAPAGAGSAQQGDGSLRELNPYAVQQTKPATIPPPQPGSVRSVPAPQPGQAPVVMPATPSSPDQLQAYMPYGVPDEDKKQDTDGSAYISLDSWVYPELLRLYSMGYLNTMFLGMRPYTRRSVMHMLQDSQDSIMEGNDTEAQDILAALLKELSAEKPDGVIERGIVYGAHQYYDRAMYVGGLTLRDSYHIGQTIANDYGRPYQPGFNDLTGAAGIAEAGRFSLYVRGEYQHAPSAAGYDPALANYMSVLDQVPYVGPNLVEDTVPSGPIAAQNPFRLVEATLSYHVLGHEISGGKQDSWLGPGAGAAFAWTNNAENIYSFRIDRIEPLHVPLLSRIFGPFRYDFFFGSLKGHTAPNSPYVDSIMASTRPTENFEFGFSRTIIFGGAGHSPVTIGKFFHSFFDLNDTNSAVKYSVNDPGARFSFFNASYRLPFVRKYATFYVDSMVHDDVSPVSAPRRSDIRAGLELSHLPYLRHMEIRAEGAFTDPKTGASMDGLFAYFETIQKQGYTNKGYIMGDSLGREGKGGQAWFTYHLSPREWIEAEYLNKKTAKDFIVYGTTQNQYKFTFVKRFAQDYELNTWFQIERWKAPVYQPGLQNDRVLAVQLSYYPHLRTNTQ